MVVRTLATCSGGRGLGFGATSVAMHSLHKARGLGRPCKQQVANWQAALHRDRLRDGLHPYSLRSLGAFAVPLRLCDFPV